MRGRCAARRRFTVVQIQAAFLGMFVALTRVGEKIMRRTVAIVSVVLVFVFAFIVTAQETSSPDETLSNLKQQLADIEGITTELRIRLEELDQQLKPENIEIALAGIGSTHPEELREHRRKLLTIERDGIQTQLDLLEEKRARIKGAIAAAEFAAYLKYALPSPTPSPAESPSKPMTQLIMLPDFGVQHVSSRTMFFGGSALILASVLLLLRQLALTMPNRSGNRTR
jgi:hypothetical protein